jgi:hypothetical protein
VGNHVSQNFVLSLARSKLALLECAANMAPFKSLAALLIASVLPSVLAELVTFEANLTWEKGAPDGNLREMIFVNGQFPGAALTLNQYDDVEVPFHPIDM